MYVLRSDVHCVFMLLMCGLNVSKKSFQSRTIKNKFNYNSLAIYILWIEYNDSDCQLTCMMIRYSDRYVLTSPENNNLISITNKNDFFRSHWLESKLLSSNIRRKCVWRGNSIFTLIEKFNKMTHLISFNASFCSPLSATCV